MGEPISILRNPFFLFFVIPHWRQGVCWELGHTPSVCLVSQTSPEHGTSGSQNSDLLSWMPTVPRSLTNVTAWLFNRPQHFKHTAMGAFALTVASNTARSFLWITCCMLPQLLTLSERVPPWHCMNDFPAPFTALTMSWHNMHHFLLTARYTSVLNFTIAKTWGILKV